MTKILVVDDEIELCDLISFQLTEEGYEVSQAYCLKEALLQFKKHQPQIILSDMQMPAGTGIELYKELRSIANAKPFNFYIMSGFVSMEEHEILNLGINAIIKKPMQFSDLLDVISQNANVGA